MFAAFKNLVIDRPSLSSTSCEIKHEVAYHAGLLKHEPRRERDRV
jgi:hypothetical protein